MNYSLRPRYYSVLDIPGSEKRGAKFVDRFFLNLLSDLQSAFQPIFRSKLGNECSKLRDGNRFLGLGDSND